MGRATCYPYQKFKGGKVRGNGVPVVWFQAAGCTGCSVSLLNADYPHLQNLLLDELVPGKALALLFHGTLMGAFGKPALAVLDQIPLEQARDYVLVVEGAVPKEEFGEVGGLPIAERLRRLGENARVVVAMGTCAAYGGVPAAAPNPTGAMGVGPFLKKQGVETPVVNVPGCPPHPRWLVETLLGVVLDGPPLSSRLDEAGRLRAAYPTLVHEACPRRADFDAGRFAKAWGQEGCLLELGCKGPYTNALCPYHAWNGGVNWCIKAGHPCLGCCEPEFPDFPFPLFRKARTEEALAAYRGSHAHPDH